MAINEEYNATNEDITDDNDANTNNNDNSTDNYNVVDIDTDLIDNDVINDTITEDEDTIIIDDETLGDTSTDNDIETITDTSNSINLSDIIATAKAVTKSNKTKDTTIVRQYATSISQTSGKYNGHTIINCNSNGSNANAELSEGANAANSNNVDLFVSLHMNASDGRGHGIEALVSGTGSGAYSYAQRLCTNFSNLGFTNRGVKCVQDYEMRHINAPNIIFEICFCDSQVDMDIFNQYSWDKLAATFCNAIDSSISIESNATVQGWNKNNTGWWYCTDTANGYYYKDQWKEIDNEWYSFDASGYARQSTWIQDGGKWYWLKNDCKMARSIWLWIDGECYSFDKSGAAYINCVTPDGYTVDETGAWNTTIPQKK